MALETNATVRIEVGTLKATDARTPPQIELRVEDAASGEVLAFVELDVATWWHLLTGSGRTLPAFVSRNLERVGRKMRTDSYEVSRAEMGPHATDDEVEPVLTGQARERFPHAERISVRRTNSGWKVVCHSWPEATS